MRNGREGGGGYLDAVTKRYALVGIMVTALSYAFLALLTVVYDMEALAANFATLIFGLSLSFACNRSFTFNYQGSNRRALLRFVMVTAIAYGVNLVVLFSVTSLKLVPDAVAQFVAFSFYTVIAYFLHRLWTFAETTP